MAWCKEPGPLSLVLVTTKEAAYAVDAGNVRRELIKSQQTVKNVIGEEKCLVRMALCCVCMKVLAFSIDVLSSHAALRGFVG
jgi:hypothetical protein